MRTLSISSPKKSRRSACSAPAGNRSTRPPRTANSPASVDRVDADIAVGLEQRGELVAVDPLAGRERRDELADAERRERALGGGVDGGDEQLRRFAGCLQRVERRRGARRMTRSVGVARS